MIKPKIIIFALIFICICLLIYILFLLQLSGSDCIKNPIVFGLTQIINEYKEDGICECKLYKPNSPIFTYGSNYSKIDFFPLGNGYKNSNLKNYDNLTILRLIYLPLDKEFPNYLDLQKTGEWITIEDKKKDIGLIEGSNTKIFYKPIPINYSNNDLCNLDIYNEIDCYTDLNQVFTDLFEHTNLTICNYVDIAGIKSVFVYLYHGHYNLSSEGEPFFVIPHGQYELGNPINLTIEGKNSSWYFNNKFRLPVCNNTYSIQTIEYSKNHV